MEAEVKKEVILNNEALKEFTSYFKALSKYITESNITFGSDGLNLVKMDGASVCLLKLNINNSFFTVYNIKEPVTININIKDFLNKIKEFKEVLKISIFEKELKLSDTTKVYSVNIQEPESETKTPELAFKEHIFLTNFKDFFKTIKTFSGFTDVIIFRTDKITKTFMLEYENNKSIIQDKLNSPIDIINKYSIDYLEGLIPLKGYAGSISLSESYPLRIAINDNSVNFEFILAPRIDEA
jgi:hypothetical protein